MKIGMENDPIEDLDREEERAIAVVVQARFRSGDVRAALQEVERVARRRIEIQAQGERQFA